MLYDYSIPKPDRMNPYEVHCLVEGLFKSDDTRNLFRDLGDAVLIRSSLKEVGGQGGSLVKNLEVGEIAFVELRASCFVTGGKNKYFLKQGDWKSRHVWLEKKGINNGFETLTITCHSKLLKIPKPHAEFTLDRTDFTACVKVTDTEKFTTALQNGIGSKGRAFGFGMLVL